MEASVTKRKCPKCGRGSLDYRTPRAFLVKTLLFWLPIRRYKCGFCDKKSYTYGSPKTEGTNDNKLEVVN
jgi:hypothetical protein